MTVQEWSIVIGVVVSGLLALGPWMFMVHAKLAVIASQIEDLCGEVDKLKHTLEPILNPVSTLVGYDEFGHEIPPNK